MIRLHSFYYWSGQNNIVGQCERCGVITSGVAADPTVLRCDCGKTSFDKLPLYYLIHNEPTMVLFSLKHKLTGKEFIGSTMNGGSNNFKTPIQNEIHNIKTRNIVPALAKDLRNFGLRAFDVKPLSFPNSLTKAMIQEKLYINGRKTMAPDGYNEVYVFEKVLKG